MTFKKFGIGVKFVNSTDPEDFAAVIDEKTKAIFVEIIANSNFTLADVAGLAKVGSVSLYIRTFTYVEIGRT